MKPGSHKVINEQTRAVELFLRQNGFPTAECYQPKDLDPLLRVRIVDERFRGLSRLEREDLVEPLIEKLPDEINTAITMLVLVTPEERDKSLLSLEFDDPTRVML